MAETLSPLQWYRKQKRLKAELFDDFLEAIRYGDLDLNELKEIMPNRPDYIAKIEIYLKGVVPINNRE